MKEEEGCWTSSTVDPLSRPPTRHQHPQLHFTRITILPSSSPTPLLPPKQRASLTLHRLMCSRTPSGVDRSARRSERRS